MLSPDWKDRLHLTSNSDRNGMRLNRYARLLENGRFHDLKFSRVIQSSQSSKTKNGMDIDIDISQRIKVIITNQVLTLLFKAVSKPVFFLFAQSDPV